MILVTLVALLSFQQLVDCQVSCLSSSGAPMDWFGALKLPSSYSLYSVSGSGSSFSADGSLSSQNDPVSTTLQQIYQGNSSIGYVLYNDEHPDGQVSYDNAHMKGVLAFDANQGFWLVHSAPKYPPATSDKYVYPGPQTKYGQSFLCITFALDALNDVAGLMQIDWPWIYDSSVPQAASSNAQNIIALIGGAQNTNPTGTFQGLTSLYGTSFTMFAKNKQWHSELYENLVASTLNTDLNVETWQNGNGDIGSYCKPNYQYNVMNVATLTLDGTNWQITDDHSKWAISTDGGSPVACIGDINRQSGQFNRGGGTVCLAQQNIWNAFNSIIVTTTGC